MSESDDIMTEIVRLQRQVAALTELSQHLFTLAGSVQRPLDKHEEAFQAIPKLLEQLRNPDV
jgi:hypothetical protein